VPVKPTRPVSKRGRQSKPKSAPNVELQRIRERLRGAGRKRGRGKLSADEIARLQQQESGLRCDPERFKTLLRRLNDRGLNLPAELSAEEVSVVADALYFAIEHKELSERLRECQQRQSHASAAITEFLPKKWPPPDGLSDRELRRWLLHNQLPMQERYRVAVNRLQGLPDAAQHRQRRDKAMLKQDWDDLRAGRSNPQYRCRPRCGLPLLDDQKCPQHFNPATERNDWHGWCEHCQHQFAPIGKVGRWDAITAIQHVRGFPSKQACYRALNRAGVNGLPSTWREMLARY
jgi:hypothetical protein